MRLRADNFTREQRTSAAWVSFICIVLALVTGGPSPAKSQVGIYSALYVYQECKTAANLSVSPEGTIPLYEPGAAFCWGAFTVLRGLMNFAENDNRTMVLHVCAPSQSSVSQYIRILLKYVDDHQNARITTSIL
jgi:hypothetical protein